MAPHNHTTDDETILRSDDSYFDEMRYTPHALPRHIIF